MSAARDLSQLMARDLLRLRQEIEAFPDDDTLWRTVPGISNAAGNLALHLEGNLRDHIGYRIAGVAYERKRDFEFGAKGLTRAELLARIDGLRELIPGSIASVSDDVLAATYPVKVWGSPIGTRQFLFHLLAHLNYHTGQIDYLRRALTGSGAIALAGLD